MALPILVTHDANLASSDALDTIAETVSDIGKVFDTITTTYMDQIVNLLENIEKNLQSATDDIHNLLHTGIQQTLKTNNKLLDMFEKMLATIAQPIKSISGFFLGIVAATRKSIFGEKEKKRESPRKKRENEADEDDSILGKLLKKIMGIFGIFKLLAVKIVAVIALIWVAFKTLSHVLKNWTFEKLKKRFLDFVDRITDKIVKSIAYLWEKQLDIVADLLDWLGFKETAQRFRDLASLMREDFGPALQEMINSIKKMNESIRSYGWAGLRIDVTQALNSVYQGIKQIIANLADEFGFGDTVARKIMSDSEYAEWKKSKERKLADQIKMADSKSTDAVATAREFIANQKEIPIDNIDPLVNEKEHRFVRDVYNPALREIKEKLQVLPQSEGERNALMSFLRNKISDVTGKAQNIEGKRSILHNKYVKPLQQVAHELDGTLSKDINTSQSLSEMLAAKQLNQSGSLVPSDYPVKLAGSMANAESGRTSAMSNVNINTINNAHTNRHTTVLPESTTPSRRIYDVP